MTSPQPVPPAPVRARASWSYRPELDGLRTFAVLVIVFFHAQVAGASASFIALDLFFVLSGFLVTNVVLAEIDVKGKLQVGRYYARRVRRLLPAAVVTILVTSVVFVMVASQPERIQVVRQAQAALLYLANWKFIADGSDYFAGDIRDSPFMHFWSLSVEEQYYIVFPLLIVLWHRWAPGRERVLLAVLGVLIAASVTSQVLWGRIDPTYAYFATDARLFQLLAGAALAVALREFATRRDESGGVTWPVVGQVLAVSGLVGYVVFGTELVAMSASHRNLLATLLAGALVVGMYTAPGVGLARVFALPWMTYLGKISYGIYLWHWPTIIVLERLFDVRPLVIALMTHVLAIAMAAASYQLLETPIRRSRWLDRFHWQSVGAGLTVSVLAALFVVGPILHSPRTPVTMASAATTEEPVEAAVTAEEVDQLEQPVPGDLDFEQIDADRGMEWQWCTPDSVEDCVLAEGEPDGQHIVLVGDSHARVVEPAVRSFAEENGHRLSVSVTSGCPWQEGLVNERGPQRHRDNCAEAREDFYSDTLPEMEPDVVVLSSLARSDREAWGDDLVPADDSGGGFYRMHQDAVDRTLDSIADAGARAVIVRSMLTTAGYDGGDDPLDCLARAEKLAECTVPWPLNRPMVDAFHMSAAVERRNTATIDVNPVLCPDAPLCSPMLDGTVVWRDRQHYSRQVIRDVSPQIHRLLRRTGFFSG